MTAHTSQRLRRRPGHEFIAPHLIRSLSLEREELLGLVRRDEQRGVRGDQPQPVKMSSDRA